jgi:hypothetical protein
MISGPAGNLTWALAGVFLACLSASSSYMLYSY